MAFSMIILAFSLSLDALGVGMVYGLRRIRIPIFPKLIICLFSILYSAMALSIGKVLGNILPPFGSKILGVAILCLMGVWIILQALLRKQEETEQKKSRLAGSKTLFKVVIKSLGITVQVVKNPAEGDIDDSGTIDIVESLLLGLALSTDAIGVGIGSALTGFHSMLIPFSIGFFQLAFLYIGTFLGEKAALIGKLNKKFLALAPGFLLISLAILRVW